MSLTTNPEQKVSTLIHAIDADVDLIRTLADQTVQALTVEKELLIALNKMTMRTNQMIEDLPDPESGASLLLDEDMRIKMESAEKKLAALIHDRQQRKKSAVQDPELRDADETDVLSGYEQAISCAQLLAQSLQELRWSAMEYDADSSPVSAKTYTDVDQMFADMRSPVSPDNNSGMRRASAAAHAAE